VIPYFDLASTQLFSELYPSDFMNAQNSGEHMVQVRTFNVKRQSRMRDLDPTDIDKLVSIKGIVLRTSDIIPEMREAFFKCLICGKEHIVPMERAMIVEPMMCENCHTKGSFELIHNRCSFSDKQHVKIQETPENVPPGETPVTLHVCCYDELVDYVKPGDQVELTGIYRAAGVRLSQHQRVIKNVYRVYIDVVNFYVSDAKRFVFSQDAEKDGLKVPAEESIVFDPELRQEIENLGKDPEIYQKLVDALAPSIWENENVKKGLLLQLFGGTSKNFSQSGRGRFRGEINVLLVGDPSTAKSQLLQCVHKLSNRGIYTSGKASSSVGLTAFVSKDPETHEIILESGALVLSDRGICCIDEFDKMNDNTKVVLHEAMEQQTISIAKAGIICQLNARTAILAAANPLDSKYNLKKSVIDNIKLPPALLSRFDLIYLMLDSPNYKQDQTLASHICQLYSTQSIANHTQIGNIRMSRELLAAYVTFARKNIHPEISEEVVPILINEYKAMRKIGSSRNTITATPRQLESIIRLSEAHARMRLSQIVQTEDVEEAVRLINVAIQQAAIDPITGLIDMGVITAGITSNSRQKFGVLTDKVKIALVFFKKGIKIRKIMKMQKVKE